jgi:hypothetical protein
MIVLCAKCGEPLDEPARCRCDEREPLTHFEAVVSTAAGLGGAEKAENIRAALEALTTRPS